MDIEIYKKALKQQKMTYEDLATKTGLSLGCIKRIMAGIAKYPRVDTIELINSALNLQSSVDWTPEERAAGFTDKRRVNITPIEDDALYVFRMIGEQFGEQAQRDYITVGENMLKLGKK